MSKPVRLALVILVLALGAWLLWRSEKQRGESATRATAPGQTSARMPGLPSAAPGTPGSPVPKSEPVKLDSGAPDSAARAQAEDGESPLAHVQMRLVDERTREPVPFLDAELGDANETLEKLHSDEAGVMRSQGTFAPGRYTLDLSAERHPGDIIQTQTRVRDARAFPSGVPLELALRAEGAPPVDLPIPVGPTYAFRSAWPSNLSPASFSVVLSCSDPRLAFDKLYAPIADGQPPWVRFSPLARFLSGGPPWLLRVTSADGLWYAGAEVQEVEGRRTQPLELVFEARSRLVGRLLDPAGSPVARQWIQAWPPGSDFSNPANRPVLTLAQEDGSFDLRAAAPGHYTFKVDCEGFLPFSEELDLPASMRVEHDFRLARPDPATLAPIRGRVTSESGNHTAGIVVLLSAKNGRTGAKSARVKWSGAAGSRVGTFEFPDLVPDLYTLKLLPETLVGIDPQERVERPAQTALEFRVQDSGPRTDLRVRVLAEESGEPIKGLRVTAALPGGVSTSTVPGSDATEAVVPEAPVGATVELTVTSPERQPVWTSTVVGENAEPLVVKLKRGWGAEFSIQGPKGEPLAGARVLLDDAAVGSTDAQGLLHVALPQQPGSCRIEYRDWKMVPNSTIAADTGKFRSWEFRLAVRLEPRN